MSVPRPCNPTVQSQAAPGPQYTQRQLEKAPRGYPRLAEFVNSNRNFALFRRFGYLRSRTILNIQDQLSELEERLIQVDADDTRQFNLATRRGDANQDRKQLLELIEQKLIAYDAAVDKYFASIERKPPDEAQISNVANWLDGNKPVVPGESNFIDDWEDLVCPQQGSDEGGLDKTLKVYGVRLRERGWARFLSATAEADKTDDPNIFLLNARRLLAISRGTSVLLASIALTLPIVVLYWLAAMKDRLIAITVFTFGFSIMLCYFTQSRNYEIFSATAAYCAVLVVFVGNLPS